MPQKQRMARYLSLCYTILMPQIEIHIERPWQTLFLIGAIVGGIWYANSGTEAMGGPEIGDRTSGDLAQVQVARDAEQQMVQMRQQQQVLLLREQILRGQLDLLDTQIEKGMPVDQEAYIQTRNDLVDLLRDKAAGEQKIVEALHQFWDAEGYAYDASRRTASDSSVPQFVWPVEPAQGISAHFDDVSYEKHFGMPHHAIDIPVAQGTVIGAAADGVVAKVSDQGMGFSSLVISHGGGMATLYGHVSGFLVKEGDHVRAGDPVALSGGTPGTRGAGLMTTGAHLHLAFYKDGNVVDPEEYLY